MSSQPPPPPEYTEEELRALETEMERVTVDDVLLQTVVSLLNLSARKAGLTAPPGEGPGPDWEQLRQGIEGARALLPLLEPRHAEELGPIRDALSRLQLHYVQNGPGQPPAPEPGAPASPSQPPAGRPPAGQPPQPQAPAPSRLWIPGQ